MLVVWKGIEFDPTGVCFPTAFKNPAQCVFKSLICSLGSKNYFRQRTLEEVGQLFGVTRERIRQIEAKALRKLRHPNRSRRLKEYVEV